MENEKRIMAYRTISKYLLFRLYLYHTQYTCINICVQTAQILIYYVDKLYYAYYDTVLKVYSYLMYNFLNVYVFSKKSKTKQNAYL